MSNNIGKLAEEIKSLTLMDAAKLVKQLEDELGISAAAPVFAPAAAAEAAAPAEVKTEFEVILGDPGAKPVEVIKCIKALTGKDLSMTKAFVDGAKVSPAVVGTYPKAKAEEIVADLKKAGADAKMQ
jgi:large subunit ribosomal protein L7/L12